MKIKHYIVTYNNNTILNNCLNSLEYSLQNYTKDYYEVFIINNHSNFSIDSKYEDRVFVLHNNLRPDFSTGHLSRNWNQAIINGFQNINNPDCDILITSQNDCEFESNFIENLIELHKKYSFIQFGAGDNFISYTIDSIKKVGLWDERFCNIGYQEADYFLRQLLFNTENCSINDNMHNRIHNSEITSIIKNTNTGHARGDQSHLDSLKYHNISEKIYLSKWATSPLYLNPNEWTYEKLKSLSQIIPSYIHYPYFEKDVETLIAQNYII
jgi:hypothetical protein